MRKKISKKELLKTLEELRKHDDPEDDHPKADQALLDYIGDLEISEAFNAITRWYA